MAYWKEGQKGIHNTGRSQVQETNKDILFLGLGGKEGEKFFEKEEAKNIQDIQSQRQACGYRVDRVTEGEGTEEVHFSSVTQSCPTLCDPMNRSTPGLPVHHQLPEFTQTHVH